MYIIFLWVNCTDPFPSVRIPCSILFHGSIDDDGIKVLQDLSQDVIGDAVDSHALEDVEVDRVMVGLR